MTINSSAPPAPNRPSFPLHLHISVLFTLLILISGAVIGWHNYRQNSGIMLSASNDLFERIARETVLEIDRIYAPIELLTDLVSRQQLPEDGTLEARVARLPGLAEGLSRNPAMSAFYVGYGDGDFFLVRPLPADDGLRNNLNAPADAAFLVQSINRGAGRPAQGRFVYFDRALKPVLTIERPDYTFDPRAREWYRLAQESAQQIKTAP